MAQYRYDGLDPETGPDGTLARPGDIRGFDTGPCWGAWTLLDAPEATESVAAGPPSQPPAPDAQDAPAAATGTDG